jgi:hypothetical protein
MVYFSEFLRTLNFEITLPDIPPHKDKIVYPKAPKTNREKKREAILELKHQQKKQKKEKYRQEDNKVIENTTPSVDAGDENTLQDTQSHLQERKEDNIICTNELT